MVVGQPLVKGPPSKPKSSTRIEPAPSPSLRNNGARTIGGPVAIARASPNCALPVSKQPNEDQSWQQIKAADQLETGAIAIRNILGSRPTAERRRLGRINPDPSARDEVLPRFQRGSRQRPYPLRPHHGNREVRTRPRAEEGQCLLRLRAFGFLAHSFLFSRHSFVTREDSWHDCTCNGTFLAGNDLTAFTLKKRCADVCR